MTMYVSALIVLLTVVQSTVYAQDDRGASRSAPPTGHVAFQLPKDVSLEFLEIKAQKNNVTQTFEFKNTGSTLQKIHFKMPVELKSECYSALSDFIIYECSDMSALKRFSPIVKMNALVKEVLTEWEIVLQGKELTEIKNELSTQKVDFLDIKKVQQFLNQMPESTRTEWISKKWITEDRTFTREWSYGEGNRAIFNGHDITTEIQLAGLYSEHKEVSDTALEMKSREVQDQWLKKGYYKVLRKEFHPLWLTKKIIKWDFQNQPGEKISVSVSFTPPLGVLDDEAKSISGVDRQGWKREFCISEAEVKGILKLKDKLTRDEGASLNLNFSNNISVAAKKFKLIVSKDKSDSILSSCWD